MFGVSLEAGSQDPASGLTPQSHPCWPFPASKESPPDFFRNVRNPRILQSKGCRTSTGQGKQSWENPPRGDPGATGHPCDFRNSTSIPN